MTVFDMLIFLVIAKLAVLFFVLDVSVGNYVYVGSQLLFQIYIQNS